jgi:nicotinamide mononucleotide adenylyltransferase
MDKLTKHLVDGLIPENLQIKTVVAIYPGRFQPMGAHHSKTYKWLKSKFKNAYVATSGKVDLPKSPFSFAEKKKIIKSHGISKIVQVKNPYKAEEILKNTTQKQQRLYLW